MLGGQTAAQIIANTLGQVPEQKKYSNVVVTAGTISHGGTIPLPSGYTRAQCKYAVWGSNFPSARYGDYEGDRSVIVNQATGGVTCLFYSYDSEGESYTTYGTAGYLCIAVK